MVLAERSVRLLLLLLIAPLCSSCHCWLSLSAQPGGSVGTREELKVSSALSQDCLVFVTMTWSYWQWNCRQAAVAAGCCGHRKPTIPLPPHRAHEYKQLLISWLWGATCISGLSKCVSPSVREPGGNGDLIPVGGCYIKADTLTCIGVLCIYVYLWNTCYTALSVSRWLDSDPETLTVSDLDLQSVGMLARFSFLPFQPPFTSFFLTSSILYSQCCKEKFSSVHSTSLRRNTVWILFKKSHTEDNKRKSRVLRVMAAVGKTTGFLWGFFFSSGRRWW